MTFRAKNKDRYRTWRSKNLPRLIEAGIPERIAGNDRLFLLLVQEGAEIGYEGWTVDQLDAQDAANLYDLLAELFETDGGWELMEDLRRTLGDSRPARS